MASTSSERIENVRGQATHLLQSIIEQATARAMEGSSAASKGGNRATRFMRSKQASPSVRDIALNAATGAIELWQAARDKAENTVDVVQHNVSDSATGLKDTVIGSATDLKDTVIGSASDLKSSAADLKDEAVDKVRHVGSAAGDTAHRAADSGKSAAASGADAGKNTLGFVFWTAAAGAVVYYAFLDESRREQARDLAMKAISEGRTLLRDLQGEDGEFA